jgi:hypothetical protein
MEDEYSPLTTSGSTYKHIYKWVESNVQITACVYSLSKASGFLSIHDDPNHGSASASISIGYCYFCPEPQGYRIDDTPIEGPPYWVRLERNGDIFTKYISPNGEPGSWEILGSEQISMSTRVKIIIGFSYNGFRTNSGDLIIAKFRSLHVGPLYNGEGWTISDSNMCSIPFGNVGIGTTNPSEKLTIRGNILLEDPNGYSVMELGQGLDYAEGFNISGENKINPGSVLIIDPANPGKLKLSHDAYDKKVAGIVASAKGLGSGVRLGAGLFDYDVALAGRVYCNVDATEFGIEPGDLLTTSAKSGYAAKAVDYTRAQGAILGKAMEPLEKGRTGQILVLVTLQ